MEKKVRYLMLLLCLFMFPMRVFAFEGTLDETQNEQENNVVVEEQQIEENLESEEESDENLVEITDLELEEEADEESNEEDTVVDEALVLMNFDGDGDEEAVEKTELKSVEINNVNTNLYVGPAEDVEFTATVSEDSGYSIEFEAWNGGKILTSSAEKNAELATDGMLLEEITNENYGGYGYELYLRVDGNYELAFTQDENIAPFPFIDLTINGVKYSGVIAEPGVTEPEVLAPECVYEDPETGARYYHITTGFRVYPMESEANYIDGIRISSTYIHAVLGSAPLYGVINETENMTLSTEVWMSRPIEYDEDSEEEYYKYSFSNPEYVSDWELTEEEKQAMFFSNFESGRMYQYGLVFKFNSSYQLRVYPEAPDEMPRFVSSTDLATDDDDEIYIPYSYGKVPVYLDGSETPVMLNIYYLGYYDEDSEEMELVIFFDETEPEEEVTSEILDNANAVLKSNSRGSLSIRANVDLELFSNVYVDDVLVAKSNYTATLGSTIITFTENFLNTLSVGTHIVKMSFNDGRIAETTLEIEEEQPVTTTTNYYSSADDNQTVYTLAAADDDSTKKDDKKNTTPEEEEEEETTNNTGLIIFLIILIIVAIAIPLTIYKKNQE